MIDPVCQRIIAVGLVGCLLTIIRRWKNDDSRAGVGVAGWTIVAIIALTTNLL